MATPPIQHEISSRRQMLWQLGGGLGGIALSKLLHESKALADDTSKPDSAARMARPHFQPKVRRVIQLFMNGGVSQMDTFDRKPELDKRHGQPFDPGTGERIEAATSAPGKLMKSPFPFKQHGQCGRWVSSVFPNIAKHVDELAFVMALASKTNVHGPASYMMNTGFLLPGFPCMGAWFSYGLGQITDNLPTFVVLPDARGLPYNAKGNFTSGFLPVSHQGVLVNIDSSSPIPDLAPSRSGKFITDQSHRQGLELLRKMNERHAAAHRRDSRLQARIEAYEIAAKMQTSAPEAIDLASESKATKRLYGLEEKTTQSFGRKCLLARRLLERGVRFVQVWSGAGGPKNNWDNHSDIHKELPAIARSVDQPVAALLTDLKTRGMLDDTLVVWSTEFGRMPFTQGATGRDHNGGTSVSWMAGAGIKGGVAYGQSDPWSWRASQGKTYCYDLHATILHLMGIDHEKLNYRHNGIDRRLTDVHGHVIRQILS